MGWLLLIMFVAIANLALGAGIAIVSGDAPPLREIIDGIIYGAEPTSDTRAAASEDSDGDETNDAANDEADPEATAASDDATAAAGAAG